MAKPHIVCIPYPAQGDINAFMHLTKLLHSRGCSITFVNSEYNHGRLLKCGAIPAAGVAVEGFGFEAVPDGLSSPPDMDATQNISELCAACDANCLHVVRELVRRVHGEGPPVTAIIRDSYMGFAQVLEEELGIPVMAFWAMSTASLMAIAQFGELIRRGYCPVKDPNYLTNGYLDTRIDWILTMPDLRLRDLPSFIRTMDINDFMLNHSQREIECSLRASSIILHTFRDLESATISAISDIAESSSIYTVGPLLELSRSVSATNTAFLHSNLWKEDNHCLEWLNNWKAQSVIYVSYGSITVVTAAQLKEFAWGLANSGCPFIWVLRPDLMAAGTDEVLTEEYREEIKNRGLITSWVPQKEVLSHASMGGFLTHCGWNSIMESISNGVPMLCWPFFADQQTNCKYVCDVWGLGMEIGGDVKREEVERLVKELMEGERGKEARKRAGEWMERAKSAAMPGGSSYSDFEKLVERFCRIIRISNMFSGFSIV